MGDDGVEGRAGGLIYPEPPRSRRRRSPPSAPTDDPSDPPWICLALLGSKALARATKQPPPRHAHHTRAKDRDRGHHRRARVRHTPAREAPARGHVHGPRRQGRLARVLRGTPPLSPCAPTHTAHPRSSPNPAASTASEPAWTKTGTRTQSTPTPTSPSCSGTPSSTMNPAVKLHRMPSPSRCVIPNTEDHHGPIPVDRVGN